MKATDKKVVGLINALLKDIAAIKYKCVLISIILPMAMITIVNGVYLRQLLNDNGNERIDSLVDYHLCLSGYYTANELVYIKSIPSFSNTDSFDIFPFVYLIKTQILIPFCEKISSLFDGKIGPYEMAGYLFVFSTVVSLLFLSEFTRANFAALKILLYRVKYTIYVLNLTALDLVIVTILGCIMVFPLYALGLFIWLFIVGIVK